MEVDFFEKHKTKEDLIKFLEDNQDNELYKKVLIDYKYEKELKPLQSELVLLQQWVQREEKKIAILFEGRDASGKGGTIKRFAEHLNPRYSRAVALNKHTEIEKQQWYFNRYIKRLPNAGEIVFFDRSWYNRAVVEPVMGFCTKEQYDRFMTQVSEFEHMLYESDTKIIKFWFSIDKETQKKRFESRDAAGKGGAIRRICEHLNPREYRVVALPKPDENEEGQWYFQRYINQMPIKGEIVFFDRSWYNRAVVEPVNGFCSQEQYNRFMNQVNDVERMLVESEIYLLKIYFSITKEEQEKRFVEIQNTPTKKWKFSPVDSKAIELWDKYTDFKEKMFENTQKVVSWKVIKANKKPMLELMPWSIS